MVDFKRDRRRTERGQAMVGGLPAGDRRRTNRKTYGEIAGEFVGFMDDLTPCRVKRGSFGKPWFRLNAQFMDVRKNRCFSGPPTHWGYCASDFEEARKLFFWYALTRTFVTHSYPMWVDAEDLWEPSIPVQHEERTFALTCAIVFAENECVETWFPANNPEPGTREIYVPNPLTPLNPESFWASEIRPRVKKGYSPASDALIDAVDSIYDRWKRHLGRRPECPAPEGRAYFVDERPLLIGAGLQQIRDYAEAFGVHEMREFFKTLQLRLKEAKEEFNQLISAPTGLDYFGSREAGSNVLGVIPTETRFEQVLARRIALAGTIVAALHDERHFGRTKLAKVFYLADRHCGLPLETDYQREAAGPLDQRALYHERIGIEALGAKYSLFVSARKGKMVRYEALSSLSGMPAFAQAQLGPDITRVEHVINLCRSLTTDQAEIVATLYACWNDLLGDGRSLDDDHIVAEFRENWSPTKSRFSDSRLRRALDWMRKNALVPRGIAPKTRHKAPNMR